MPSQTIKQSPWIEYMPGREEEYKYGIAGPRQNLTRLNQLFTTGRTRQVGSAIDQLGKQRYGVFGAPWGDVPEALDRHLREVVGVSPDILQQLQEDVNAGRVNTLYAEEKMKRYATDEDVGPSAEPGSGQSPGEEGFVGGDFSDGLMGDGPSMSSGGGGGGGNQMGPDLGADDPLVKKTGKKYSGKVEMLMMQALAGERDEGIRLVETRPGYFEWKGWENDPEYRAYIEGLGAQRSAAARGRMAAGPPQMAGPMMKGSGGYDQLKQLYATQDARAPTRPGGTEATKPGAVVYPDTPGFIGQQAAEHGQQRRAQKSALDQFYEAYGYDG